MPLIGERGSGNVIERDFDVRDFDSVSAGYAFTVDLEQGNEFAVTVEADDNVMDEVIVDVVGGELQLGLPNGKIFVNRTLRAHVTLPELSGITASGATRVNMSSAFPSVDEFSATASGASTIEGSIETDTLTVDVSGASTLQLAGSAEEMEAVLSGASRLRAGQLTAERANVRVSGASNADIVVTDSLDVVASGASHVNYAGGATLRSSNSTGASSINER